MQPGPLVFGLDEAAQSGLSAAAVRHGLRTGRFVRLRRGLFCDATLWQRTGASPMARRVLETRAAWLAIGRRGWASHYTAALLHGLPVPYGQPAAVTISRTNRADGRHCLPGLVLRTATVDPVDIVTDWGMPIASAARTSLDLARVHGFAPALVVADAALARGAAMSAELDRIATSMAGWKGAVDARLVARHASGRRESPNESWSFAVFVDRKLPLPACNEWVIGEGRGGVRSDFVWKPHRMVGEADGRVKYTDPHGDPEIVLADEKARQLRIEELGFVVVRWTGTEIQHHPTASSTGSSASRRSRTPCSECLCSCPDGRDRSGTGASPPAADLHTAHRTVAPGTPEWCRRARVVRIAQRVAAPCGWRFRAVVDSVRAGTDPRRGHRSGP
ncbi:MAG TPA: type IV toxin-antitoxin system AbiEi family antitoxin domain-containing protein [Jiangellaceae bacterium]|nr:type IV toxin-antitoxin system AbiEi family antitoxin domain-containing protein [Jiangellaceae bacterium]